MSIESDVHCVENARASTGQVGAETPLLAFPLSPRQLRIWRADRANPGDRVYNVAHRLELRGALNVRVMEQVWADLVARHEILRATCGEIDGLPALLIADRADIRIGSSDLRLLPATEREVALERLCTQEAQASLDVARGPLLRVGVIRVDDQRHVLTMTLHAIICDSWSIGILTGEIARLYAAFERGLGSPLAAPPIQYGDYAVWNAARLTSPETSRQLRHWTARLAGCALTRIAPDHVRAEISDADSEIVSARLDRSLTDALKHWCGRHGGTLDTTMLTACLAVLHRHGGGKDLCIGTPTTNRCAPELETLVGPVVDQILVRVPCDGDPRLADFAATVREAVWDAFAHQDVPAELVLATALPPAPADAPRWPPIHIAPINVACMSEVTDPSKRGRVLAIDGLAMRSMPWKSPGARYDLDILLIERDGVWTLSIEYRARLYSPRTAGRMLRDIEAALLAIATSESTRLSALRGPGSAEHGDAGVLAPADHERVARTPTETAVLAIWESVLDQRGIGLDDDFFDLGGHSLHVATCVRKIEAALGVRLDISTLATARTVTALSARIDGIITARANTGGAGRDIIVPLQPHGQKAPLFCIHGGGGHVLHFLPFAARMPKDRPILALSAPEMDGAINTLDMEGLARLYLAEIRKVQPSGPVHLCGYSAGGTVAYAIATRLAEAGEPLGKLVILDGANWWHYRHLPAGELARFWATVAADRTGRYCRLITNGKFALIGQNLGAFIQRKAQRWTWMAARKVFRFSGRPLPNAVKSNMELFMAIAREYKPRQYAGNLLLLRAQPRDAEYKLNPTLGWENQAIGGVLVRHLNGDHLTFMEEPHVGDLVEHVVAHFADDQDPSPRP